MQDTEPFVYLGYLTIAIFLIGASFMIMQASVDSTMHFTNVEASGSNVGMAKNFYLLNQGDRFGKFESGQLEDLKLEHCKIDLPGYIEERPRHKVDSSCDYYEDSGRERRASQIAEEYAESEGVDLPDRNSEPRVRSFAVVSGEDDLRTITSTIPLAVTSPKTGDSGE